MEQLLLFEESREEKLEREVMKLRDQCERMRKSQFAKIGELRKLYDETRHDLDVLKSAICKNEMNLFSVSR